MLLEPLSQLFGEGAFQYFVQILFLYAAQGDFALVIQTAVHPTPVVEDAHMGFQGMAGAGCVFVADSGPFKAGILVQVEPSLYGETFVATAEMFQIRGGGLGKAESPGNLRD